MAIELLMACQAIDLLQPLASTPPLQAVHDLVRQTIAYVFRIIYVNQFLLFFFSFKYLG